MEKLRRFSRREFIKLGVTSLALALVEGCGLKKELSVTDEQYAALVQMYGEKQADEWENGIRKLKELDRAVYVDDGLWAKKAIELKDVTDRYFDTKGWDRNKEEGWPEPVIIKVGLDGVAQGSWNGQPWELEIRPGETFRLFEEDKDGNGQLDLFAWRIPIIYEILQDSSKGEWVTVIQR